MKISLITETFPPEINGVAMTLGRLADGLATRGVEVTVIAPRRKNRPTDDPQATIKQLPVRGLPIPTYPELRFGFPAHRKLRNHWSSNPPNIIHVATEGPLGWSAFRAARKQGIPVVSSFHTNFHAYGSHYGYGFLTNIVLNWMRYCHSFSRITYVPSVDVIKELTKSDFKNLQLFARGVDTSLFGPHRRSAELRKSWGADDSTPVAIYVGRIANEKNLPLTVKAYLKIQKSFPDLKIVFVGDGPARKSLEKSLPDAVFAGMQTGEDLARHYASADIFCFASTTETFGNVVTEAMASGLCVLAYNYAAPSKFIKPGENGLLADFNNEESYLIQVDKLIENRANWSATGTRAHQTMQPHSWDSIVQGYYDSISALVAQPVKS